MHIGEAVTSRFVVNSEGYLEIQLVMSDFEDISIDFYP